MNKNKLKTIAAIMLLFSLAVTAFTQSRKEINIPDIKDYKTLKGDFHMHTVFSDGSVWPDVRIDEAWFEGLDAIAITDHLEANLRRDDIIGDDNRSYDLAVSKAKLSGILLIKATELTKSMPPGHFNALFIKDANPLDMDDHRKSLRIAREQGAFVMWNHPGWKAQAPDSAIWYDEHEYLHNEGLFQGVEVYNSDESYGQKVYGWAKDKNLAIMASSDIHSLVSHKYDLNNSHRPMTLIFSKDRSLEGIKEALFARRTAAYFNDTIVGQKKHLQSIFKHSLKYKSKARLRKDKTIVLQIFNHSDINYELTLEEKSKDFNIPQHIILYAHKTNILIITGLSDRINKLEKIYLPYSVRNLIVIPGKNLQTKIEVINIKQ